MIRRPTHSPATCLKRGPRAFVKHCGKNWSCLALTLFLIGACSSISTVAPDPTELTHCTGSRPEMCAQVYAPVCATVDPELKSAWKSYSNACMACADRAVRAYRAGSCAAN
jgi:hypothetical protein